MKKKSLLKDQTGAIPWVKLVVMVVVVAAAGIAALMIYKPKIPTTEPAAVRAKVPPTPVTHAIPVPQEQPDATAEQQPAAAAAPDQSPPVAPLTQEDEADSSPDPALPREETEPSPREIGTVNPSPESDPASTPDDAEPAAAQEPSVPPIQPYEERTPTAGDSAPDEPQAALPAQVGSPPEPQPTAAPLRETAS
ncbi:MAG: hypothetical protein HKP58_05075, partial [Desulfatitalea sp.]|nr:hypothetical protein [Desulfatitalea sp.]NNJ99765.1 hypothetical protein [Desulfatitalea sp.]